MMLKGKRTNRLNIPKGKDKVVRSLVFTMDDEIHMNNVKRSRSDKDHV